MSLYLFKILYCYTEYCLRENNMSFIVKHLFELCIFYKNKGESYGLWYMDYVCMELDSLWHMDYWIMYVIIYDIWITNDIVYEIIYKIENVMASRIKSIFLFRWIFLGMILFYAKWIIFMGLWTMHRFFRYEPIWDMSTWNMKHDGKYYALSEWMG